MCKISEPFLLIIPCVLVYCTAHGMCAFRGDVRKQKKAVKNEILEVLEASSLPKMCGKYLVGIEK